VVNPALTDLAGRRLSTQVKKWSAAKKPTRDAIVILIGINDILANKSLEPSKSAFRTELGKITPAIVSSGSQLVISTVPDLGRMPAVQGAQRKANMTERSKKWNAFLKGVAEDAEAEVVDLFGALTNPKLLQKDGLHPNAAGQKVIADLIDAALEEAPAEALVAEEETTGEVVEEETVVAEQPAVVDTDPADAETSTEPTVTPTESPSATPVIDPTLVTVSGVEPDMATDEAVTD
jgi:lysophospholipase L1-like esterase